MTVSYATDIRILQFVFFVPVLALVLGLCVRQGFKAAVSIWRFILLLALLRIAGDIAYFVALHDPTEAAVVTVVICDLIGLAPLTLACVRLVARINESTRTMPPKIFDAIGVLSLVGLVLGIVGAILDVDFSNGEASTHTGAIFKAAVGLFIACTALYVLVLGVILFIVATSAHYPHKLGKENWVLGAAVLSTPFLLVRLIDASIGDLSNIRAFALIGGSNTIYLVMSVLPEIIVTAICMVAGYMAPLRPDLGVIGSEVDEAGGDGIMSKLSVHHVRTAE